MSVLQETMKDCRFIYVIKVDDGYGGQKPQIIEGAHIKCAIVLNNSTEAQIAQKQGTTAYYEIYTDKSVNINYHDVIKRLSDGKTFRATSNGVDDKTPDSAGIPLRRVTAEEWEIPTELTDE